METETAIYIQYYTSPCGRLSLGSYGNHLCLCDWTEASHHARILHSLGRLPNVTIANAVGANPLSIFGSCHRVTGADGSLTGYAGGIHAKRFLLTLEDAI